MKRIAMCWKCSNSSMVRVHDKDRGYDSMKMVACDAAPGIRSYEDAATMCPILKELADKECEK